MAHFLSEHYDLETLTFDLLTLQLHVSRTTFSSMFSFLDIFDGLDSGIKADTGQTDGRTRCNSYNAGPHNEKNKLKTITNR